MDSFYDMKNNNTAYSSEPKLNTSSNPDSKHDASNVNQASSNRNPRRRASKSSYYFGHRAKQPSGSSFSSSSDKSEYNWPFTGEDGPTGPSQAGVFAPPASESTPSQQMILREIGAALTL